MNKLGVAVVGTGFWGQNHVRVYNELPETNLVAICDANPVRAQEIAEKYGVPKYTDSKELLKREDVEAVSICVWATNLAEETMKALMAGKHVFVEKPMARNYYQAEKMVDLARENNLRLMVGFIERFNGVQQFKKIIDNGKIGDLITAVASRLSRWPERIRGVGVVKDLAIHDVDVMRHIFAEEPTEVYANTGGINHRTFEQFAQIILTFEQEKTAFIESNWITSRKIRNVRATGMNGDLYLNYVTHEITLETENNSQTWKNCEEPLKMELKHFANCVSEDKKPSVTGVDGAKALRIADAALKSSSQHKPINLTWD